MHFSQLDKKIGSETWFSAGPEWCDLVRGPDLSVRSGQTMFAKHVYAVTVMLETSLCWWLNGGDHF